MPYVSGFLRTRHRRDRWGRPVDPDYGIDEGGGGPDQGFDPDYPDQGLPGGEYPDQGLPSGGLGNHPSHGLPPSWGGFPGHPSTGPVRPGRPVDPSWGIGQGGSAGQLPVWPIGPGQGLPPVPGQPLPPTDPPPGTIWPPLPPGAAPTGKALALVWLQGVGYRYVVFTVAPPTPGQGLPPAPGQGLPTPPEAQPKR